MKFQRVLVVFAALISPLVVNATPIVYDEAEDGDLDGSALFEFGVGDNSVTGRFGQGSNADGESFFDFDGFSFVIGENQRLTQLTYSFFDTDIAAATSLAFAGYRFSRAGTSTQCLFQTTNVAGSQGGQISHSGCDTADPLFMTTSDFDFLTSGTWRFSQFFQTNGRVGEPSGGLWSYNLTFSVEEISVPAPSTLLLLLLGFFGIAFAKRH